MAVPLDIRLINTHEYHQMGESLILHPDERVELIRGQIIHMSPIGSEHAHIVDTLNLLLIEQIGREAVIRIHNPITLGEYSEPEPDIVIAKTPRSNYKEKHPIPEDILLLIEVAHTYLQVDREIKLPLYASFHIPCVWLIDIEKKEISIHTQPNNDGYAHIEIISLHKNEQISFSKPTFSLSLDEIFQ